MKLQHDISEISSGGNVYRHAGNDTVTPGRTGFHARHADHTYDDTREYSSPDAFTYKGTTYMPLYYVEKMLMTSGIQNSWDGSHTLQIWTLKTKQSQSVNLNLAAKSGSVDVVISGKTVCRNIDKVVDVDPSTNQKTTFVPIWYIQQVLK